MALVNHRHTSYSGGETTKNVMLNFDKLSKNLFQLFYLNQMKDNTRKCHLLLSTGEKVTTNIQDLNITNSKYKSLWISQ